MRVCSNVNDILYAAEYPEIAEKRLKEINIPLGHRRKLVKSLKGEPLPLLLTPAGHGRLKPPATGGSSLTQVRAKDTFYNYAAATGCVSV